MKIQPSIKYQKDIKNIDNKLPDSINILVSEHKITTDFRIFNKNKNVAEFFCDVSQSPKLPKLQLISFVASDGFSGISVNIMKYDNKFRTDIESITDNLGTFDFLKSSNYKVIKQHLILNKLDYKPGDSIFGKVELEIKHKFSDSIIHSNGYFKTLVR
ncbi:hypothetical protein [Elizabethkingia miricola]|uniref:hypothetical protein n=1 Tax=Elizabethkingia miricola TaxID=172045 RepID=UPI00099A431B|nr:hypothetical protein [Elizabethkingia miricola]OPC36766.1 hypothetical protein BAX99_17310 [Elizabethkingia miricola]